MFKTQSLRFWKILNRCYLLSDRNFQNFSFQHQSSYYKDQEKNYETYQKKFYYQNLKFISDLISYLRKIIKDEISNRYNFFSGRKDKEKNYETYQKNLQPFAMFAQNFPWLYFIIAWICIVRFIKKT